MGIKQGPTFSLVFLAMTTILLAGHGHAHSNPAADHDLCEKADYSALCRSVLQGVTDPRAGLQLTIHQLISQTGKARASAVRRGKSQNLRVCAENLDDAVDNLNVSLKNLENNDLASLNVNLSAALTDYETCNDAFEESGKINPIGKMDELLHRMASNCLYLASLLQ